MKEKIGKATLDLTYYPGEDLYTDGKVEDTLLEIAKNNKEEEWNAEIARRKSWPVLYHFSHIRQNILRWIPFTGEEKVLEIGSGCGAITGILCDRAKEVTCIELSKKRSEINAWRNREKENLEILLGNFQEVEKHLTEKYDYITLIGVFEYGEAYIDSETPYVDFLKIIAKHLKPSGKIIMAIENRFGLKYWAGCTEDHFGILFEGIEGYPNTKGVKTFTKKELNQILEEAGNLKAEYYYPYPDYKFPMMIFSDERLPQKGELNRMEENYDRLRLKLFKESAVSDSLIENNLFSEFSNSFLLMIGKEQIGEQEKIIYSKFSNERDTAYSICTDISYNADKKKYVQKYPCYREAAEHVEKIVKSWEILREKFETAGIYLNTCEKIQNGVQLEYLEGTTLEEHLDHLLGKGKIEEVKKQLLFYADKIRNIYQGEMFSITKEFENVFGKTELLGTFSCGKATDIDLAAGNIFLKEGKITIIDYEWTFDFPIPADYVVYRFLHYYIMSDEKRFCLDAKKLMRAAGIEEKEEKIYEKMERNFQKYMEGTHHSMLSMYQNISPGKVDAVSFYTNHNADERKEIKYLQVFYDQGSGTTEENSIKYVIKNNKIQQKIQIKEGTKMLRLDPGEKEGGIRILSIRNENQEIRYTTNGRYCGKKIYYYLYGDPQIYIVDEIDKQTNITVELELLEDKESRQYLEQSIEKKEANYQKIKNLLKEKENLIREMENTKVWKLYRKIRLGGN